MEPDTYGIKRRSCTKDDVPEDVQTDTDMTKKLKQPVTSTGIQNVSKFSEHASPETGNACGEVNMEADVSADEVIRAGGFGTTDDISNPITVASDCTNFESHLHDVRDFDDLGDDVAEQPASCVDFTEVCVGDFKGVENVRDHEKTPPRDVFESVYAEASATDDEVIRAGGFGATDDISSLLPVASDFTDFEAHLRNAQDYEDLEKETTRPGLGWNIDMK